jgi:ADP-heptose:LPS heptosyltransferase
VTVLVLRALALGDLLTAVPALRGLRRRFAGQRIVLATAGPLAGLAALSGAVDVILPTQGLQPLDWRGPPPEVAVNLHGRGPQSHQILDALRPARRIGYGAGWGPPWRESVHEVDRWCALTGGDPADLRLSVDAASNGLTLIHPGAAYGCRRWPPGRYAAVARSLLADGHEVAITGSATERDLAAAVASRAAGSVVLAGTTSVLGLAALVAGARLVICGDTGVAHLATAFGTPSVLLFGPVSPALWGPRTDGPHAVLWHPELVRGDRWAADPDPALLAITPDEVLAATRPPQIPRVCGR